MAASDRFADNFEWCIYGEHGEAKSASVKIVNAQWSIVKLYYFITNEIQLRHGSVPRINHR